MAIKLVPTIIYSLMLGMTLFALLQLSNRPWQKQTRFLAGLLLLLLLHIAGNLFMASGAYIYAPSLAGAELPIRVLLGPALYFYACATMAPKKQHPWRSYIIAASGPCWVILAMAPFVFGLTAEQKLSLADPATRDPELFKIALFACLSAMVIFVIFTACYLIATVRLHTRHRAAIMERFSAIEQRSLDWFKVILLLWGSAWLLFALDFILGFMGWRWQGARYLLPALEGIILMAFAHLALKQPLLQDEETSTGTGQAYRNQRLATDTMQHIADKLMATMTTECLFQDEELSLKRLSDAIDVSENHISETLSQYLHTNFFHFVNRYRIDQAKALLRTSNKLISTIAYEVGFNSKSTFNNAFKREVGSTPTHYRKQQISNTLVNAGH